MRNSESQFLRTLSTVLVFFLACFAAVWFAGSPLPVSTFLMVAVGTSTLAGVIIGLAKIGDGTTDPKGVFVRTFTFVFAFTAAILTIVWASGSVLGVIQFGMVTLGVAAFCGVVGGIASVILKQ